MHIQTCLAAWVKIDGWSHFKVFWSEVYIYLCAFLLKSNKISIQETKNACDCSAIFNVNLQNYLSVFLLSRMKFRKTTTPLMATLLKGLDRQNIKIPLNRRLRKSTTNISKGPGRSGLKLKRIHQNSTDTSSPASSRYICGKRTCMPSCQRFGIFFCWEHIPQLNIEADHLETISRWGFTQGCL